MWKITEETIANFSSAYPTGRGIAVEPENSPGPSTFSSVPNRILHSDRKETVQKGRKKSW